MPENVSIERKMTVSMDKLRELEKIRGISIRALAEQRFDKARRTQGGIRPDNTYYSPEKMPNGLCGEFAGYEMFGERIDTTYRAFGDLGVDFKKPIPWGNESETKFDIKSLNEMIVNVPVIGKSCVYILCPGDPVNGYRLEGWITAPDLRTFVPQTKQGPMLKHVCPDSALRPIEELWKFIDNNERITNVIQKGSNW